MAVHQIEEYYLHIEGKFSDPVKKSIEEYLSDEGFANYSFEDGFLVVDDIYNESEADALEDSIINLMDNK